MPVFIKRNISQHHNKNNWQQIEIINIFVFHTYLNNRNYEDLLIKDEDFPRVATIQSKVIKEPYLKVFRIFNESVENRIYNYHPTLKPKDDKRGFKTGIIKYNSTESLKNRDSLTKKYLEVFNETHQVYIDTVKYDSDFLITKNNKKLNKLATKKR